MRGMMRQRVLTDRGSPAGPRRGATDGRSGPESSRFRGPGSGLGGRSGGLAGTARRRAIAGRLLTDAVGLIAFVALAMSVAAPPAHALKSAPHASPPVEARLIAAEDGVRPDAHTISAGLELELAEGWKTYWRSPGEVGLPPEIRWTGSDNVADVTMLWPAPTRFRAFGIENFGYADEVVFPLQVRLERPGQPVELRASVALLVCADICVPEEFDLALDLPAGSGVDPAAAARIAAFAERVPAWGDAVAMRAGEAHITDEALTFSVRGDVPFRAPDVFPERDGAAFGPPDIRVGEGGRTLWARLPVLARGEGPLSVTVTDGLRAATFAAPLGDTLPAPPFGREGTERGSGELAWIALLALLGGLVLNVMPCVLPVLSIKLSSAAKAGGRSSARVRGGFLLSALGVLAFMWGLAAAMLAARGLGHSVGWGLHFQNPIFLTATIAILVLFAANLAGLYEIDLPSSWQTRMARSGGPGYGGDFATGAFAAVLATPCSAPFLGTAVAFALAGRPLEIAVIFTALGLGLALPYLVVAACPRLVRVLPRPGRWILVLKAGLASLLGLTAAWLVWVLAGVAGGRAAGAVALLLALLLGLVWQCRRLRPTVATAAALVLAGMTFAAPLALPAPDQAPRAGADWTVFDRGEIARQVAAGRVVFVDVTADWCLTCKANKALVIDRSEVAEALRAPGIVAMQADWTRSDPAISRYLEAFDRYGIPFNAVYGPGAPEGIVLPELLTSGAVLDALHRAAGA